MSPLPPVKDIKGPPMEQKRVWGLSLSVCVCERETDKGILSCLCPAELFSDTWELVGVVVKPGLIKYVLGAAGRTEIVSAHPSVR